MFSKKKKKIEISAPSNFQHRVHTGFDNHSNKFVGLPKQWASLVDDKPGVESPLRPSPMVDPSSYTDVLDDSTSSGGGHPGKNPYANNHHQRLMQNSVVRSNSLRSNSPPQFRRRGPPAAPPPHLPPVPETDDRFQHAQQFHPSQGYHNQHQRQVPPPGHPNHVQPGMVSNRSSVSDQSYPPPLQRPQQPPNGNNANHPGGGGQPPPPPMNHHPNQAYHVSHPPSSHPNSGMIRSQHHPQHVHHQQQPSRPISAISINDSEATMVPGGTNVIPDYDPATIRAMNLSRAENLMSQKHSIQHGQHQHGQQQQPPPLPASNREQMVHPGTHPYPPGQHSPASSSSSDMPPMRGATAHPNHAQLHQLQQQQQQVYHVQHQQQLNGGGQVPPPQLYRPSPSEQLHQQQQQRLPRPPVEHPTHPVQHQGSMVAVVDFFEYQ